MHEDTILTPIEAPPRCRLLVRLMLSGFFLSGCGDSLSEGTQSGSSGEDRLAEVDPSDFDRNEDPGSPGGLDQAPSEAEADLIARVRRLHNGADLCGNFVPDDVPVGNVPQTLTNIGDHEFDPDLGRIVFSNRVVNRQGRTVSTTIYSGDILPSGDVGTLEVVDDQGVNFECVGLPFGNGPEWGASQTNPQPTLYYTKGGPGRSFLVRATRLASPRNGRQWAIDQLPDSENRSCLLSSVERSEPLTWLGHAVASGGPLNPQSDFVWRYDEDEPTEAPVLGLNPESITGGSPGRKVPGRLELAGAVTDPKSEQVQIGRIDLVSGRTLPISRYERSGIELNSVNVAPVPRLSEHAYLYYGIVNNTYIDAYLTIDEPDQRPIIVRLPPIQPESRFPFIIDEENVLDARGHPIIVFSTGEPDGDRPPANGDGRDIWIANPFASESCRYRKVTLDEDLETARIDLDSLSIPNGSTFVYYQKQLPGDRNRSTPRRTVLYRARTGL